MRTLTLSTGSFDQVNTFNVAHPRRAKDYLPMRAALYRDYAKVGDGVYWAMQIAGCIKSSYSDADRAEIDRLNVEPALTNGEVVLIDGHQYRTEIKGAYSDCAVFHPVA
ncbi:MAG: hypothetical protein EHM78_01970 [Myxococcaceae bacterium]|nr:MAG: hypothetical protein EHM78_01970 [Myxococcaceae bacterium]